MWLRAESVLIGPRSCSLFYIKYKNCHSVAARGRPFRAMKCILINWNAMSTDRAGARVCVCCYLRRRASTSTAWPGPGRFDLRLTRAEIHSGLRPVIIMWFMADEKKKKKEASQWQGGVTLHLPCSVNSPPRQPGRSLMTVTSVTVRLGPLSTWVCLVGVGNKPKHFVLT